MDWMTSKLWVSQYVEARTVGMSTHIHGVRLVGKADHGPANALVDMTRCPTMLCLGLSTLCWTVFPVKKS